MKPGGTPLDTKSMAEGALRADLSEIAINHCFQHGARLIDAILAAYTVEKKK